MNPAEGQEPGRKGGPKGLSRPLRRKGCGD